MGDAKEKEHKRAVSTALSGHVERIDRLRSGARVEADEALEDALKQADNHSKDLSSRIEAVAKIRWRVIESAAAWVDAAIEATRRGSERRRYRRQERVQQRAGELNDVQLDRLSRYPLGLPVLSPRVARPFSVGTRRCADL